MVRSADCRRFTAKHARAAKEHKSLTVQDAGDAEKDKSFTAKNAKAAEGK